MCRQHPAGVGLASGPWGTFTRKAHCGPVPHACHVTGKKLTPFGLRDRVRRLPAGEVIVRVIVFLMGLTLIGTGLALSVLPGPLTIPPVLLGVLIWSLEFEFAQRWLDRVEGPAQLAWERAKEHPVRTAVVSAGGVAAAVLLTTLALTQDWAGIVADRVRDALT